MQDKVLIITYYWPPSGGSGVQRWLKFVKYLPSLGIEPHVYTPLNPDFNVKDDSFLRDIPNEAVVIKKKIIEPYGFYRLLVGKKNAEGANSGMANKKEGTKQKLAMWVRSNFFIPDPRVFWVKPSIRFLKKYIEENNIEKIITSGPPHSMHLIGLRLKKHFGSKIEWATDFRDPWTRVYNKDDFKLSKRSRNKINKLENEVISNCDKLITVSNFLRSEFIEMGADENKVYAVTNGYDEDDFVSNEIIQKDKFIIAYYGFLPEVSNPKILWEVLGELINENKKIKENLELRFIGRVDSSILEDIKTNKLENNTSVSGYVKHSELKEYYKDAQVLLLTIANVENSKGILTGKIFEYLASKRPILAFGDTEGEVNKILNETNSGVLCGYNKKEKVRNSLLSLFEDYENKKLHISTSQIDMYSRRNLTKKIVELIFK